MSAPLAFAFGFPEALPEDACSFFVARCLSCISLRSAFVISFWLFFGGSDGEWTLLASAAVASFLGLWAFTFVPGADGASVGLPRFFEFVEAIC